MFTITGQRYYTGSLYKTDNFMIKVRDIEKEREKTSFSFLFCYIPNYKEIVIASNLVKTWISREGRAEVCRLIQIFKIMTFSTKL